MPLKVWDGSAWQEVGAIKVWNGSSWVNSFAGSTWNGSSWVNFFPSVRLNNNNADNLSRAGLGGTATATYRLAASGQASATNLSGVLTAISGEWLAGAGTTSDYEVRGTWSGSGGTVGGPSGWVSLGTTRDYTLTVTNNAVTRDLALEIRVAATSLVIATATITFEVDSAP